MKVLLTLFYTTNTVVTQYARSIILCNISKRIMSYMIELLWSYSYDDHNSKYSFPCGMLMLTECCHMSNVSCIDCYV